MGGCRNRSVPIPFVPHSPRMILGFLTFGGPPFWALRIAFDSRMDTAVIPNLINFTAMMDATPCAITSWTWVSPFVADMTVNGVWTGALGIFIYHTVDLLLRSESGIIAVAPQIQQFFP